MTDFREFTEQVKLATDIVEVIGEHLELKKAGKNFKGLCPFHKEKTPSFSVSPEGQFFHCFGCSAGGDVIEFVRRVESLDFREAIAQLAGRLGLPVPEFREERGRSGVQRGRKEALYELHELAQEVYRKELAQNSTAGDYCRRRGLDAETIERFGIGFGGAWRKLIQLAQQRGYSAEALLESGIAARSEKSGELYNRFAERLTFPIHDPRGRISGFGGRLLTDAQDRPKYLNSAETPIYHKGRSLYGFHLAKAAVQEAGRALVCEGYLDLIALHQFGFRNSVANLGTAFGEDQGRLVGRLCKEVALLYDGDEAGQKAMLRACETLLPQGFSIRVVTFDAADDPDTLLRREGREGLERLLDGALDYLDFFLHCAAQRFDRGQAEGKESIVEFMLPLLGRIASPIVAEDSRRRIAEFLELEERILNAALARHQRRRPTGLKEDITAGVTGAPPFEEKLLRLMASHPEVRAVMVERLNTELISHEYARHWIEEIIHLASSGEEVSAKALALRGSSDNQEQLAFLRSALLEEPDVVEEVEELCQEVITKLERHHRNRLTHEHSGRVAAAQKAQQDDSARRHEKQLMDSWRSEKMAIDVHYHPNPPDPKKARIN